MNDVLVTVDLDWACESAIEDTLDFLKNQHILPTVFVTHRSPRVEASMNEVEVGLHPYFAPDSSHGATVSDVVKSVMELPHNLPAFRCHRFAVSNCSRKAMAEVGMLVSSNVCTDLELVAPFKDRFGLLELPVFLEDGGYLWRKHPLQLSQSLLQKILGSGIKVIIIHPMHFSLNTPHFDFMLQIKHSLSREEWKTMGKEAMNDLRWKGRGIRDFMIELLQSVPKTAFCKTFRSFC